jgi:hypothetical protein
MPGHSVLDVLAVRHDFYSTALPQRGQTRDNGAKFHSIVCRVLFRPAQRPLD